MSWNGYSRGSNPSLSERKQRSDAEMDDWLKSYLASPPEPRYSPIPIGSIPPADTRGTGFGRESSRDYGDGREEEINRERVRLQTTRLTSRITELSPMIANAESDAKEAKIRIAQIDVEIASLQSRLRALVSDKGKLEKAISLPMTYTNEQRQLRIQLSQLPTR